MQNRYNFVRYKYLIFIALTAVIALPYSYSDQSQSIDWALIPFIKQDSTNPCLIPDKNSTFNCPLRNELILWEGKDVFNPAAVVKDGKVYLLYRAEDDIGRHSGTSRIGIAESTDGLNFVKHPEPVLYPDLDFMKKYEWEGGCEDPRIVEDQNGIYYMTYTAYNGHLARLCIATSTDLFHWQKRGIIFEKVGAGKYRNLWSKSGSIICKKIGNRLVATKVKGKYWMYWGDREIYAAISDNLIDWQPLEDEDGKLRYLFSPRKRKFDSALVEAGPPAVITDKGILFIYNSKNSSRHGDRSLPAGTYAAGQVLFDADNPVKVKRRLENHFFKPERNYEVSGQVNNVCFLEGLIFFKNKWFLYYGTADSKIAAAIHDPAKAQFFNK